MKNLDKVKEALISIGVGEHVLEELEKEGLKIPRLKGNYKKFYDEYKDFIKLDEKNFPEENLSSFNEGIDEELLAIECFLRWLQEDKKVELK